MSPDQAGVLTAAVFVPRNLAVGAATGAAALLLLVAGLWPLSLVALAGGSFAFWRMVSRTAADPDFARKALDEADWVRGAKRQTPRLADGQAVPLKGRYLEIQKRSRSVLEEVSRKLQRAPDAFLRSQLQSLGPGLEGMVKRIETLCATAQRLEAEGSRAGDSREQLRDLEHRMEAASEESQREHYRRALEQKRAVVENVEWMMQTAGRMDAELASLESSLDRLRSDVLRLVATGAEGAGDAGRLQVEALAQQWEGIETAVGALEELKADDRKRAERSRVR